MIDYSDILFFDTETTGIPPKGADWSVDYKEFPQIAEIAWCFGRKMESHIIRPDGWSIPESATEIHGISTAYAKERGDALLDVLIAFLADCKRAKLIVGHNVYFDTSIIKANILNYLGEHFYQTYEVNEALDKSKRIDTMRASMKWVDARTSSGRLKFPTLLEMYRRCFLKDFEAHCALNDVQALKECLPVLVSEGVVELKLKDYSEQTKLYPERLKVLDKPEEKPQQGEGAPISPEIGLNSGDNSANKEIITPSESRPKNELSGADELLNLDKF